MKKPVISSVEIHPVLAQRWSPRSFQRQYKIAESEVTGILEAARWSPSASNSQPWRFVVAHAGTPEFEKISKTLAGFNANWAPNASLYIVVATQTLNADGSARPWALYDAGIASANATTEAHHRGLAVHQIAGFDHEAIEKEFNFPTGLRPLTILVIGKQAPVEELTEEVLRAREEAKRERIPLADLILNS